VRLVQCKIAELRCKEVINIHTGFRLGYVFDVLFNAATGQIVSLIVPGPWRFFGLFGRGEDYIVPWDCIRRIGEDIILIDVGGEYRREKRRRFRW
jgi:YlmC/YmxH family sporulation protein